MQDGQKTALTFSWQYVAGLFDGEGWATCASTKAACYPNIRLGIAQSGDIGHELLSDLQVWLKERGIQSRLYAEKMDHKATKVPYKLIIAQKESVYRFIEAVKPFLHVKLNQVTGVQWTREIYWLAKETRRAPKAWPDFDYLNIERCVV